MVAVSIMVRKYLLPCVDIGVSGPQRSNEMASPGIYLCVALLYDALLALPAKHPEHAMMGGGFSNDLGIGSVFAFAMLCIVLGYT